MHAIANLVLTFIGIRYIHPFFSLKLRDTEILLVSMLVNMQDDSGFKLVQTRNKKFNAFLRGKAMINFIISMTIGFSINKDHHAMETGHISIGKDLMIFGLTFCSSLTFSFILGIIISFMFANFSSIRQNRSNEILYLLFSTYLIAAIGFFDKTWDYNSEELAVIFFGIFCSHYARYNLRLESASRLR